MSIPSSPPGSSPGLGQRRILVVGASSGIGMAVARAAAARGARVALAARRRQKLEDVAAELPDAVAVTADVCRPEDCARLVDEAAAALGGLDALVYAAGVVPLARLADADAAHWRRVFETNVFGAAWITRAALPHLENGLAAYVSSDSVGRPRPGLGAYSASKAALDELIRAFRAEQPATRFLRVVVGPTVGTEAGRDYDPALLGELLQSWKAGGFAVDPMMDADEVGRLLAELLASALAHPGVALEDLRLEPPAGHLPSRRSKVVP